METITSAQNPLIKHLFKLRTNRSYRHEQKKLILVGEKLVRDVCEKHSAETILFVNTPPAVSANKTFQTTPSIIKKISGVDSPEGIIAEVAMPEIQIESHENRIVALDGIQDPGNLGTLIRTALAFNWGAVWFLPNCCDPFNEKALRAAKGATFKIPLCTGSWEELANLNHVCYAADTEGTKIENVSPHKKLTLILGSEGQGLTEKSLQISEKITIPMHKQSESLNVGVAGGILMYLLGR